MRFQFMAWSAYTGKKNCGTGIKNGGTENLRIVSKNYDVNKNQKELWNGGYLGIGWILCYSCLI